MWEIHQKSTQWMASRGSKAGVSEVSSISGVAWGQAGRPSQSCWGSPCTPQAALTARWDPLLLSWDFPGLLTRVPLFTLVSTVPPDHLARPSPSDTPSWLRSAESNPTPRDPVSFLLLTAVSRHQQERPASLSNVSFVVTPIPDVHSPKASQ